MAFIVLENRCLGRLKSRGKKNRPFKMLRGAKGTQTTTKNCYRANSPI